MKTDSSNDYDSNITKNDLNTLGEKRQNQRASQLGDDAQLASRTQPVDFAGSDLDIPGRKQTNALNDEENKLHSLGSAHNGHLEDHNNHSQKSK